METQGLVGDWITDSFSKRINTSTGQDSSQGGVDAVPGSSDTVCDALKQEIFQHRWKNVVGEAQCHILTFASSSISHLELGVHRNTT